MRGFALIGFMGAGKSTVGMALAQRLKLPFVDLDERIQSVEGRSISELFAAKRFRVAEQQALKAVLREGPLVLACGGGTPCQADAMSALLAWGTVVFLDAPMETLRERVGRGEGRPLWTDEVEALLARRICVYRSAHRTIDARRPVRDIVSSLC